MPDNANRSLGEFREHEVEVVLTISAPNGDEAMKALLRSGIREGQLIGEAMVAGVVVYGRDE